MIRINIALAILLMVSAFSLVTSRYQSRQLYMEFDRAQTQARELEINWRQLQLDRAEYAQHARVDRAAREDLHMIAIVPDRTIYLNSSSFKEDKRF